MVNSVSSDQRPSSEGSVKPTESPASIGRKSKSLSVSTEPDNDEQREAKPEKLQRQPSSLRKSPKFPSTSILGRLSPRNGHSPQGNLKRSRSVAVDGRKDCIVNTHSPILRTRSLKESPTNAYPFENFLPFQASFRGMGIGTEESRDEEGEEVLFIDEEEEKELRERLEHIDAQQQELETVIREAKTTLQQSNNVSFEDGSMSATDKSETSQQCDIAVEAQRIEVSVEKGVQFHAEEQKDENSAPQSLLHLICAHCTTLDELLSAKGHISVIAVAKTDEDGKTPLHALSQNHHLSSLIADTQLDDTSVSNREKKKRHDRRAHGSSISQNPSNESASMGKAEMEQQMIDFIVMNLWRAYRPAMITPDNTGYIPFQEALTEWVQEAHFKVSSNQPPSSRASFWKSSRSFRGMWARSGDVSPTDDPHEVVSPTGRSNMSRFPNVSLTAHALFCFKVLSAMILRMDARLGNSHRSRKRSVVVHSVLTEGGGREHDDSINHAVKELKEMTVADIGTEIVQSIANIPDLLKTILLIDDKDHRVAVLSTVIMRRVLAHKCSVGGWLTKMLQSDNKRASDRAIEYLKIVSNPDLFENNRSGGSWRQSKRSLISTNTDQFPQKSQQDQDSLYNEISGLQDFVPSLLSLGEREVEEAATTRLVAKVLDKLISRPFAATVVLCDAIFLSLLIAGLQLAVNHLLLGSYPGTVANILYIANTGLFYFLIRELGKVISLLMMTRRARVYFWSFWNLTGLLSTILALASIVALRAHLASSINPNTVPTPLRNVLAVTTGFLWLRVLSFLKGINQQLATFVLAIIQITKDVVWFCVILLTLVVSFAQMLFTLLAPAYCAEPESDESNNKECVPSEYYLGVYAVLLGDFGTFERESFTTAFSVLLAVIFTFIVVLVLLNVLIAVASDSYEKCLVRSQNLFGRARVMLIAELVSFQNLFRCNNDDTIAPRRVYNPFWSQRTWVNGWSRGSIMFFGLSLSFVTLWVIWETSGLFSDSNYGNLWLGLASIFINIVLFVAIMLFLSFGAADITSTLSPRKGGDGGRMQSNGCCGEIYTRFIQGAMLRLLGTSGDDTTKGSDTDAWRGRLVFLQNEMTRIAEESKMENSRKLEDIETQILQSETRLRNELLQVEGEIQSMKDISGSLKKRVKDIHEKIVPEENHRPAGKQERRSQSLDGPRGASSGERRSGNNGRPPLP